MGSKIEVGTIGETLFDRYLHQYDYDKHYCIWARSTTDGTE
ncbi:MAG: hypothetical protein ABH952_08140 [Candidatus Omnitrophota bacterium]